MKSCISVLFTAFFLLRFVEYSFEMMGPHLLQRNSPGAFQIFVQLPHLVAISDSNNDTIMECLTIERTELNLKDQTASYVFLFRGHHGTEKKNVTFFITPGPTPETFEFHTDEDPSLKDISTIPYWNRKNCFVADGPYHGGEQCMLLVSKGTEDDVPRECIEQFEDICGVAVINYSRDLCPDV